MTTSVKRTYVSPDESIEQRERPGFVPVECYGDIAPEGNELGAIAKKLGITASSMAFG